MPYPYSTLLMYIHFIYIDIRMYRWMYTCISSFESHMAASGHVVLESSSQEESGMTWANILIDWLL